MTYRWNALDLLFHLMWFLIVSSPKYHNYLIHFIVVARKKKNLLK